MIGSSLNRLSSAYTVKFGTWEEAYEVLGKLMKKLDDGGRVSVLDLNPNEDTYLREYGWIAPVQFHIYGGEIGVHRRYTFFGDYESVDLLGLGPEITDILRNENINEIWQVSDAIRSAGKTGKLPIYGIGAVYSEKIRDAYDEYVTNYMKKENTNDAAQE